MNQTGLRHDLHQLVDWDQLHVGARVVSHVGLVVVWLVGLKIAAPNHGTALPARYGVWVASGDAFHLSTVCGLTVARIAGDHAILIEEMKILILAFSPHSSPPERRTSQVL